MKPSKEAKKKAAEILAEDAAEQTAAEQAEKAKRDAEVQEVKQQEAAERKVAEQAATEQAERVARWESAVNTEQVAREALAALDKEHVEAVSHARSLANKRTPLIRQVRAAETARAELAKLGLDKATVPKAKNTKSRGGA